MAELKTKPNNLSVQSFLKSVENDTRRADGQTLLQLMEKITGAKAKMWGSSIIGFGSYHYKYKSGREGDWFLAGFSPRKQSLVLYIMTGFSRYAELMESLGKHSTGKGCLYIKKLSDVDMVVLEDLITSSVTYLKEKS